MQLLVPGAQVQEGWGHGQPPLSPKDTSHSSRSSCTAVGLPIGVFDGITSLGISWHPQIMHKDVCSCALQSLSCCGN